MGIHQWKFSDKVDPNLICSVCREVFENPVRTTCGHVFCRQCVSEWLSFGNDNCPECRKALKEEDVSADRLIASLIGNLVVHCPNGKEQKQKQQMEENMLRNTMLQSSSSLPHKTATACKEAQSHSIQKAHQENGVNCTAVSRLKGSPKQAIRTTTSMVKLGNAQRRKGAKTGPASSSPSCSSGMAGARANIDSTTQKKKRRRTVSLRINVDMRLQMAYAMLLRIVFVHGKEIFGTGKACSVVCL